MKHSAIEIDLHPSALLEAQRQATIHRVPLRRYLSKKVSELLDDPDKDSEDNEPEREAREEVAQS